MAGLIGFAENSSGSFGSGVLRDGANFITSDTAEDHTHRFPLSGPLG
jgi:hypothetical protein